MSIFTLHLDDTLGGADIKDALSEAHRIAVVLNLTVTFDFNNIELSVSPSDVPDSLLYDYYEQLNRRENAFISGLTAKVTR